MKIYKISISKHASLIFIMALAGLLLTSIKLAANQRIQAYKLTGYAYDIKTGRYVYAERHTEYYQNAMHLYSIVNYTDAKGKLIVRKRINFQKSKIAPDFKTTDIRTGYIEGANNINSKSFKLFNKESKHNPFKSKVVSINTNTVIDGGFDYFIRINRNQIQAGKALSIEFPIASRVSTFNFKIRKSNTTVFNKQRAHHIKMSINNRLLRLLIDPISVYYDTKTWRLLGYSGLSNISDENGKGYKVNIIYKYTAGDPSATQ